MNLCCQINGNVKCRFCKRMFCGDHAYRGTWKEKSCVKCYNAEVRKGELKKTYGSTMTFKQLYLKVRKAVPKGYLSVTVALQDLNPGIASFKFEWNVYHESHGNVVAETPEGVYTLFMNMINGEKTSVDQINV